MPYEMVAAGRNLDKFILLFKINHDLQKYLLNTRKHSLNVRKLVLNIRQHVLINTTAGVLNLRYPFSGHHTHTYIKLIRGHGRGWYV